MAVEMIGDPRSPPEFVWRIANVVVVDGDTLRAHVDIGRGIWLLGRSRNGETIRLNGLDAPENRIPTIMESRAAKAWLKDKIKDRSLKVVSHDNPEKYGRILGTLWIVGEPMSVNDQMIEAGHAKPYDGGHKD